MRAERLSRLVSGGITIFEGALSVLTRRGRPPVARDEHDTGAELVLTRELLALATALLARAQLHRRDVRDLVVGAWWRLSSHAGITQKRFCAALALPARTLRSWLAQASAAAPSPPAPPLPARPLPPRRIRRRRFGLRFTLPGTQVAADTTDIEVFGVPLKLIAAQDVGGRDTSLFDAVLVDDHESAELVADVLERALADKEGAQAITDQGTPYLADKTREALTRLGVEHAPQKEGDPCGKSTIERAFLTIKSIAATIFATLNHVGDALPALRDPALAKAAATLVLTALLRAYQHGARAARATNAARAGVDAQTLFRLGSEARQQARAEDRSRRLMLAHIHSIYSLPGVERAFVNTFAKYPLSVLRDAKRAFQSQVHRDDICDRKSYFAAIVRKEYGEHRLTALREARHRDDAQHLARELGERTAQCAPWADDPAAWLRDALAMLALQRNVRERTLLFGGEGLGLGWVTPALRCLFHLHDARIADDLVAGTLHAFRLA